jgi:beta-lactamase regulating signal transducer with metallopeptidase domain
LIVAISHSEVAARLRAERKMLWTIFAILLVLWLLGIAAGSFIHLLLALVVGVLLIRIIEGRTTVQ